MAASRRKCATTASAMSAIAAAAATAAGNGARYPAAASAKNAAATGAATIATAATRRDGFGLVTGIGGRERTVQVGLSHDRLRMDHDRISSTATAATRLASVV